jgi:xanthine dehydrogenase small subunit
MIRFLHGDREVAIEHWRRTPRSWSTCASTARSAAPRRAAPPGDCGACTVVVVAPDGERAAYEPVNACIATVGSLHGKQLITVEDSSTASPGTRCSAP